MKKITYVAGFLGLLAVIAIILDQDRDAILNAFDRAGWALLWFIPFHALPLALDVLGWRLLVAPFDANKQAGMGSLFWIAAVREAFNRLLPVANIGGEIIGVRMAKWRGLNGAAATAGIVVEVLLTLLNQYLFTALGILLMIALTQQVDTLNTILGALVISLPVPIALFVLLHRGRIFSRLEVMAEKMLGGRSKLMELVNGQGQRLDQDIRTLCGQPWRLMGAGVWQLAGLIVGSLETWLALKMLGFPISIWEALAIEAVTQALRHIIFIVPAGLGVQEGGLVLFGSLIGIPPDASIALSLVKRIREIGFGVPALISWQWAEMRRLRAGLGDDTPAKVCKDTQPVH